MVNEAELEPESIRAHGCNLAEGFNPSQGFDFFVDFCYTFALFNFVSADDKCTASILGK